MLPPPPYVLPPLGGAVGYWFAGGPLLSSSAPPQHNITSSSPSSSCTLNKPFTVNEWITWKYFKAQKFFQHKCWWWGNYLQHSISLPPNQFFFLTGLLDNVKIWQKSNHKHTKRYGQRISIVKLQKTNIRDIWNEIEKKIVGWTLCYFFLWSCVSAIPSLKNLSPILYIFW